MPTRTHVLAVPLLLLVGFCACALDVDPDARLADTDTGILGVSHIALSVRDLDTSLAFYAGATGFELVSRHRVDNDANADRLYGRTDIAYETATLRGPTMLLELTAFDHHADRAAEKMPPQGPGMTHTCFQSPASEPGFDKFVDAGADVLTTGGRPVDLGGYGVTYAYAYDPDGNMLELEQLDGEILERSGYDDAWSTRGKPALWMSQVALATHDLERLMGFYESVLGIAPYRVSEVLDNPQADRIVGIDGFHGRAGWFRLNNSSKVLEIWQYILPPTPPAQPVHDATHPGYSFAFEVDDIVAEHRRLGDLGVEFVSAPVRLGERWQAFGFDPDGNLFSLRQWVDTDAPLSLRRLDPLD